MSDIAQSLQGALGDQYLIERELGGGGMSHVFLVRDKALLRSVVVKVLPRNLAEQVSLERFQREILMLAGLQHPNIVPILSAGQFEGLPYFIMPFVQGESIRQRLARGPMSVRECVNVMRDVARALSFAHERGIVHRDIKPDNVLLAGGSCTVTDFGVAKALKASGDQPKDPAASTITGYGISLGTPAYMAPEQVAADPATDHRADLYSLGVVAYEMLLGAPPFQGRTRQAIMTAQLTERPALVSQRRGDVSEALADLIARCLEKEPEKRPQNAAVVARALDDPAIMVVLAAENRERRARMRQMVMRIGLFVGIGLLAVAAWRVGGS